MAAGEGRRQQSPRHLPEAEGAAFLTGSAAILFEISLTRVFVLAQGYHFAFLAVSLALLGGAAGGAVVATWRPASAGGRLRQRPYLWCALSGASLPLALALAGRLPVDVYALSWSVKQVALLFVYVACLAVPFVLAGISLALSLEKARTAARAYGANLAGSAVGAALAAFALPWLGPARTVVLAGALAGLSLAALLPGWRRSLALGIVLAALFLPWQSLLPLPISPYKPLWQALHAQGARLVASYWSRSGRVDVVQGPNLRMAGGIAPDCPELVPAQRLLFLDGDSPRPITEVEAAGETGFVRCLPAWPALRARPSARTLVLEPAGDVPIWLALAATAGRVDVVEPSAGVARGLLNPAWGSAALHSARASLLLANPRALLLQGAAGQERWQIIYLPLRGGYHPVAWGAASLSEDYTLTVEAFRAALAALPPDGLLVAECWLQAPPSEPLRLWLTAIAAVGRDAGAHLMAARSMQTLLVAVSPKPWSENELAYWRAATRQAGLDLVWLPGLRPEESNRINLLPDDPYYPAFARALQEDKSWLRSYPFSVVPATDGRPFPQDYFKWSQTGAILARLGRTSLPFGGLGFLILPLMLIVLAPLVAMLLVPPLLPVRRPPPASLLLAFSALGAGYMLVELPLVQQSLLLFRDVPMAMALVLSAMLVGSGLASLMAGRRPLWVALAAPLAAAALALAMGGRLMAVLLLVPGWLQVLAVAVFALLTGLGLGCAFPALLQARANEPGRRAWALAANGAASVVGSVLATGVAVLWGFALAYGLALAVYAFAAIVAIPRASTSAGAPPS